ncbi:hypothetical protein SBA3_3630004 [Candidatus Sulfopaludibacter sp. SbA3]|nr:hypothetical protein SBA3_3630004 [Candidatus Sulfopaludibacter sp. SbA3]
MAAACLAAFDVLEDEPERIERLWENTRYFKAGLKSAGFDTGISETPITPVITGDAALAHQLSRELFEGGWPPESGFRRCRRARRGCGRLSRPRTRKRTWIARWRFFTKSGRSWGSLFRREDVFV